MCIPKVWRDAEGFLPVHEISVRDIQNLISIRVDLKNKTYQISLIFLNKIHFVDQTENFGFR
jgi:hypothetical protein